MHLYWNQLEKASFAHGAAYSDGNDLAKRTIPDKILKYRTYEIARSCNYGGYKSVLANMVYKLWRIGSERKWTTSWRIP